MKQVKFVQRTPDELDVTVILKKALDFFHHYGKLIAGVALMGLLAGLLRFWYVPNLYTSTMVLQPSVLSDPEQIALINNWATLLQKKELPELAAEFHMDVAALKKVISITAEELQHSYTPNNFTAFTLTVLVSDTSILQSLQYGILYALDHSAYVKEKLTARKRTLQLLIQSTKQEISRLNHLQQTLDSNLRTGNNAHNGFIVDVSGISGEITTLEEKRLNLEDSQSFITAVQVLQNFYIPTHPEFPKLFKLTGLGCAGGLLLGMMLALFINVRTKIKTHNGLPADVATKTNH